MSSFCFSFCILAVGGTVFLLHLSRPKLGSLSFAGCLPHQTCAPSELRKTFAGKKPFDEKSLEDYGSCNVEKAECIGQLLCQETTIQNYSLLLSDYQKMHHSAYGREGSFTRKEKERIARVGSIQTKPSMINWKSETDSELSVAAPFQGTLETQQDLIHRLKNRDNILCRERYDVGPYYIQFDFSVGRGIEEHEAMIIEIPSRIFLPHTVLTFLTLVEAETYSGYNISLSPSHLFVEMNRLDEKYEAHRIAEGTLGLIESSTKFPCTTNSVRFLGRGPQFVVLLDDDLDENQNASNHTCFGRVVRGMKSIEALQTDVDLSIHIAWAKILDL